MAVDVAEYLTNMRELLAKDRAKFGLVVERQVQFRLLPQVAGHRAALEPLLWDLLVFCADGHEARAPALDDAAFARATELVRAGKGMVKAEAVWPRAAAAVLEALTALRQSGIYPPPKIR